MNRQKVKSETEMEKIREGNRIRARNYRERQKALGIEKKRPKPKTRQKISEQREYCRIKKQESFSRRKYVSRKRTAKMSKNKKRKTKSEKSNQIFSSPSAEEKTTQRVKQYLPKSAEKMAKVIINIISIASPTKRAVLERVGKQHQKREK